MKAKSRRYAKKIKFTVKEMEFLSNNEGCRIATVSPDNTPHITPVSYIFQNDMLYFATDYDTKKYKNLKQNPNIALVVDIYSLKNSAIIIQGKVDFIEQGIKFQKLYEIFDRKFEWVRADPWKESEAPFVQVEPYKKISWGS
ncbi:MAG TPA: pyridoxamine 5'-phosphate oxidase family protein [Nitrososphaeraceae archaeon]|nr:pyridoxamine 5'-phosphate oxidase family protein [Nitrososphaeraceae archaeon]